MSYQQERETFIADMIREGMSLACARKVLRHAQTIQRCAELECSSEAADRDRVRCPNPSDENCLCRGYGSYDPNATTGGKPDPHGTIPRIARQSWRMEHAIAKALPAGFAADFQGDPRGACVKLIVPSGRTDDWGRTGMCVPTRG